MPRLPDKKIRPWQTKPKPQEGRKEKVYTEDGVYIYHSARWKALRKAQLAADPFCAICLERNILTPATVCDHIIQVRKDKSRAFDPDNVRSLCSRCHNSVSGKQAHKK